MENRFHFSFNAPLVRARVALLAGAMVAGAAAVASLLAGCTRDTPLPLNHETVEQALAVPSATALAEQAKARGLAGSVELDPNKPLTPDSAAVLAVLLNPSVRADRNRLAISSAQLFQAGLLPNPQFTATNDWVSSGPGVVNPFGLGITWDFTSLIWREAKLQSAKLADASIRLDVAWNEWQAAQAAKSAVYELVALRQELQFAAGVDDRLRHNVEIVRAAVGRHDKTLPDLATAEAAAQTAQSDRFALEQQAAHQRQVLLRALGLPPATAVQVADSAALPSKLPIPAANSLMNGLEDRRLDLRALRRGYEAEEANVRVAILQQFPKINIGPTRTEDNTGVHTWGFSATMDVPLFDQYQGPIRTEQATRQKLFDEFTNRVFQARSDIAMILADADALNRQIAAAEATLPSLRSATKAYQTAAAQRNVDELAYVTAENDLAEKEIALLKLKQQLADARIALEVSAGMILTPPATTAPSTLPAMTEARR